MLHQSGEVFEYVPGGVPLSVGGRDSLGVRQRPRRGEDCEPGQQVPLVLRQQLFAPREGVADGALPSGKIGRTGTDVQRAS